MKTKNIPIAANKQKYFKAGKIVEAPMAKANKSVTEVIVMATPACFIAMPNLIESTLAISFSSCNPKIRHLILKYIINF